MLFSSLTLSLVNKAIQNLLRNFGSRSVISSPEKPQSTKSKHFKKAWAHYSIDHVSIPLIKVIHFENLHMTDIKVLNSPRAKGRARIKSKINV